MRHIYLSALLLLLTVFNALAQVYCPVSFPAGVSAVTEVKFGTMTHTSPASGSPAYEDFTAVPDTVYAGMEQLIVKGSTGGNFTDTVMAYFDWNQDWDFTDPGESYYVGTITNSAGSNLTEAAITLITPGIIPGYIRMRIVKARGALAGSCNATGTGQAEDYNVFVVPAPPCSGTPLAGLASGPAYVCPGQPFVLSVAGYSNTSWHFYQWEHSPLGLSQWTPIAGATTPTYVVQGTSLPGDYRMVATCANAGGFDLTNTVTVSTTFATLTGNSPLCIGDTIVVNVSTCPTCTVSIAGPGGFNTFQSFSITNAGLQHEGWYIAATSGGGCTGLDSIFVDVSDCQDSVWPGDVNHDYITNYVDALELAVYNGQTGVVRPGASIAYIGQACPDWLTFSAGNVNLKHADCNGDGIVNLIDTLPIHQHYNVPHLKPGYTPKPKISSVPDLYFDTTGVQFIPNIWAVIPLKLGTPTFPMNTLLGMGSEIRFSGFTLTQPLQLTHNSSWLGTATLNFQEHTGNHQLDFVHTRHDHNTASGQGTIGELHLFIPSGTLGDTGLLWLNNEVLVDGAGNVISGYNVLPTSFIVQSPLAVSGPFLVQHPVILPNPSSNASLVFSAAGDAQLKVTVCDVAGRSLWSGGYTAKTGRHTLSLPGSLPPGMYLVRIIVEGTGPQTLKWLKL